jgi:hypothetical protein
MMKKTFMPAPFSAKDANDLIDYLIQDLDTGADVLNHTPSEDPTYPDMNRDITDQFELIDRFRVWYGMSDAVFEAKILLTQHLRHWYAWYLKN